MGEGKLGIDETILKKISRHYSVRIDGQVDPRIYRILARGF